MLTASQTASQLAANESSPAKESRADRMKRIQREDQERLRLLDEVDPIPDTFPEVDSIDSLDAIRGRVPRFVWYASFGAGRLLTRSDWNALSPRQQRYVQASLSSRGIVLYRRGKDMVTIEQGLNGRPVEFCEMERLDYQFFPAWDDHRINDDERVGFVVHGARNPVEAKRLVRAFIKDLIKLGCKII